MNEDVGVAAVLGDEAEALLGVEPLDGALSHVYVPFEDHDPHHANRWPRGALCPTDHVSGERKSARYRHPAGAAKRTRMRTETGLTVTQPGRKVRPLIDDQGPDP